MARTYARVRHEQQHLQETGWLGNLVEDDGYETLREYLCVTHSNDPVVYHETK